MDDDVYRVCPESTSSNSTKPHHRQRTLRYLSEPLTLPATVIKFIGLLTTRFSINTLAFIHEVLYISIRLHAFSIGACTGKLHATAFRCN